MPKSKNITIKFEGMPEEDGHLRLDVLAKILDRLLKSLKKTETGVSGKKPETYYRVVELSHSSPVTAVLEPVSAEDAPPGAIEQLLESYSTTLSAISKGDLAPPWADTPTLETIRGLTTDLGKNLQYGSITVGSGTFDIDSRFKANLDDLLADASSCYGDVQGELLVLDLRGKKPIFGVEPAGAGPSYYRCYVANEELKEQALKFLGKGVRVYGKLFYNKSDPYPSRVDAEAIEVLLDPEDAPSLADLRGIAPDATGRLSSVDFVRKLRDEWTY